MTSPSACTSTVLQDFFSPWHADTNEVSFCTSQTTNFPTPERSGGWRPFTHHAQPWQAPSMDNHLTSICKIDEWVGSCKPSPSCPLGRMPSPIDWGLLLLPGSRKSIGIQKYAFRNLKQQKLDKPLSVFDRSHWWAVHALLLLLQGLVLSLMQPVLGECQNSLPQMSPLI